MSSILTKEEYQQFQKRKMIRFEKVQQLEGMQERKEWQETNYQQYLQTIEDNYKKDYEEIRGWGIVDPVIELKTIAPLCKYPYYNHLKGCTFCNKKRFLKDIMVPPIWALYFSMDLRPLWDRMKRFYPWWSMAQVMNSRYWRATKHKLVKEIEQNFLKEHPGPWIRAMNRAPGHITYTFGIDYALTMEQIEVYMQWPPEPFPLTIQFLGQPIEDMDYSWANFILE